MKRQWGAVTESDPDQVRIPAETVLVLRAALVPLPPIRPVFPRARALGKRSIWRRFLDVVRWRARPLIYCSRCHNPRHGQRLPALPAAREVCHGTVDFADQGQRPRLMCIRLERRLG